MGSFSGPGGVGSTVAIGEIEGATLVIESEGIAANDNDTTIPTSAAVKDYADGASGISNVVEDLTPQLGANLDLNGNGFGDAGDLTKELTLSLSGATTAKTMTILSSHTDDRTLTLPDATGTLLYGGGALGTPSGGTLTNCSGLPVANITGDAATAFAVGSIELGHASDTSITRTGAGAIAVEGTAVLLSGGALGTPSGGTLTNCTGLPASSLTSGTLAEDVSIGLDNALSGDEKYTGITIAGTSGYTQTAGDCVYLDPTDSRWEACDANAAAGADGDCRGMVGIVVSAGTDGNACTILLQGTVRSANFPAFTVNEPLYISETADLITHTAPSTTDAVVRTIGFALSATDMYFNPSPDYITAV